MKALRVLGLFIGIIAVGWFLGMQYCKQSDAGPHIDWMCGTITANDGSREPVKISIDNEMSFDLRRAPGLLHLRRCDSSTPLVSIK